jgi:hypothetical protein
MPPSRRLGHAATADQICDRLGQSTQFMDTICENFEEGARSLVTHRALLE